VEDPFHIPAEQQAADAKARESVAAAEAKKAADAQHEDFLAGLDDLNHIPETPTLRSSLASLLSDEGGSARMPTGEDALRGAEMLGKAAGAPLRGFDKAAISIINRVSRALGHGDAVDQTGTLTVGKEAMDAIGAYLRTKKQNALADKLSAALVDKYALPENYIAKREAMNQTQNEIARKFQAANEQHLAGLSPAEQQTVYNLVTDANAPAGAYQSLRSDLRRLVDQMGERAVQAGVISRESFDRNRGEYLARSYAEHELGNKASKAIGSLGRAVKFAASQMKGRGVERSVADSTLARLQPVGTSQAGKPLYSINGQTWELRQPGRLWRDWTKAERQQMGEIEDASYAFLKTGHQLARNVATGEFYQSLAGDASLAKKAATEAEAQQLHHDGWIHVGNEKMQGTGKPRWGALADHWIQPDVHRDLAEIQRMQQSGLWKELLNQWKMNKTARNPVVHLNNVMSNFSLLELNGGNVDDVPKALRIMAGHGNASEKALYEKAKELGVFGDVHQELGSQLRSMIKDVGPVRAGMTFPEKAWHFIKSVDQKMLNAYGAEDGVFRFALMMNDVANGMPLDQAAKRAHTAFVDYNITAPAVNAARRSVLPFIGYAYRALPLLVRGIAERPWKAAKIALAWQGANALFSAIAGGNENEERAAMNGQVKNAPFMMRLPGKDARGQQRYLDTTKFIPGADILGGALAAKQTGDPAEFAKGLGSTFSLGGPVGDVMNVYNNYNPQTQQPIWNENTPKGRQWIDTAKYALESAAPNNPLVPGTYSFNKVAAAALGKPDQYGREDTLPAATLATLGMKTRGVDVTELGGKREMAIARQVKAAEDVIKIASIRHDRGIISDAEFQRVIDEQQGVMQAAAQRLQDYQTRVAEAGNNAVASR
jgi:hypothetical protein